MHDTTLILNQIFTRYMSPFILTLASCHVLVLLSEREFIYLLVLDHKFKYMYINIHYVDSKHKVASSNPL